MAKSSKVQIEKDEKKVLHELQNNAKESIDKIAKKCGFSRQKTWRIIKNLEKDDSIWGYTAVVDEEKMGKKGYLLLFKGANYPMEEKTEKIILDRQLQKTADKMDVIVRDSHWVHGMFDGAIYFFADDIKRAKEFQQQFTTLHSGNVGDMVLLETIVPIERGGFVNPTIKRTKKLS